MGISSLSGQGLLTLPPTVVANNTQRNLLVPSDGLQVFVNSTGLLNIYDGASSTWLEIGSYTEVLSSTTQTGSASSDFTYATAEVTCTPGRWLLEAGLTLYNTVTGDTVSCGIWDQTAGVIVANSTGEAGTSNTTVAIGCLSLPTYVTISTTKAYRPRARRNGASTIRAEAFAGAPAGWIRATLVGPQ